MMPQPGVHPTVPWGQTGQQGQPTGQWGLDPGTQYSVGQPGGWQQGGQQQGGTGFPFGGQGQQAGGQAWQGGVQGGWQQQGWQNGGQQSFGPNGQPVMQNQPHPTVPWGQGFGVGETGSAPQQGWGGAATQGWGQQGPTQGQGWGQQGGGQSRGTVLADDAILDGPNIPAELRGRTFGQVKAIYTALSTDWLNRQAAERARMTGGQSQQGQGQSQGWGTQGQQGGQPQGGQQGQQGRVQWDWSNPAEAFRNVVREELGTMMQPVLQQSAATGVVQARTVAMQQIPDFAQLEGTIMQHVANLPPESLAQPQVWVNAARLARGELMEQGQYRFTGAGQQNGNGQQNGGRPAGFGGQQGQPTLGGMVQAQGGSFQAPPGFGFQSPGLVSVPAAPHQFFTEGPTAPGFSEFGSGGLTPAEDFVRQQMGMSPEQYIVWKGGVQR